MSYNKEKDVNAGYIGHKYALMLTDIIASQKRTKRATLELLIEEAFSRLEVK